MYLDKTKTEKIVTEFLFKKGLKSKRELWEIVKKKEPKRRVFSLTNFYNKLNGTESINTDTLKNLCSILGVKKEEIL